MQEYLQNANISARQRYLSTSLVTLSKEFEVKFEAYAKTFSGGLKKMLDMTNFNNCCNYTEGVLAVWNTNEIGIAFVSNGNGDYRTHFKIERKEWTKIKISQKKHNEVYVYEIEVGKPLYRYSVINKRPEEFINVITYASYPWIDGGLVQIDVTLRNLEICSKEM